MDKYLTAIINHKSFIIIINEETIIICKFLTLMTYDRVKQIRPGSMNHKGRMPDVRKHAMAITLS